MLPVLYGEKGGERWLPLGWNARLTRRAPGARALRRPRLCGVRKAIWRGWLVRESVLSIGSALRLGSGLDWPLLQATDPPQHAFSHLQNEGKNTLGPDDGARAGTQHKAECPPFAAMKGGWDVNSQRCGEREGAEDDIDPRSSSVQVCASQIKISF